MHVLGLQSLIVKYERPSFVRQFQEDGVPHITPKA